MYHVICYKVIKIKENPAGYRHDEGSGLGRFRLQESKVMEEGRDLL
jgi:hypothetical protein